MEKEEETQPGDEGGCGVWEEVSGILQTRRQSGTVKGLCGQDSRLGRL